MRGAFANDLAQTSPERAHAVLTLNAQRGYTVSVRAPRNRAGGADAFCRSFATGGGRVGAAGINHLPASELPRFTRELEHAFQPGV